MANAKRLVGLFGLLMAKLVHESRPNPFRLILIFYVWPAWWVLWPLW